MTKRNGRISSQNYRKVQISDVQSLTTLASQTVAGATILNAATDAVKVTSVALNFVWDDMTGTGGSANEDGPLLVGVCHGDYSVTEIKEYIESASSMDFGDKIAAEHSRRLVRIVGTLSAMQISTPASGGLRKVKLNWTLGEGDSLVAFFYNTGGGPLTTGSSVVTSGHANVFRL